MIRMKATKLPISTVVYADADIEDPAFLLCPVACDGCPVRLGDDTVTWVISVDR